MLYSSHLAVKRTSGSIPGLVHYFVASHSLDWYRSRTKALANLKLIYAPLPYDVHAYWYIVELKAWINIMR